ncbi:MAG: YciI-like protein [Acidobacteriota bacterium]
MKHYLLIYEVGPEYLERRGEFRSEHLALGWKSHERGELVLGGALADPVDQAILLFKGEGPEVAEAFANADPYVKNGLIRRWSVRPWTTVIGDLASNPIKPA